MLNRSGITTDTYGAPKQILANVELQASVGCIVHSQPTECLFRSASISSVLSGSVYCASRFTF